MKLQETKKLLASFYEGQTTFDEELLLFNYFSSTDVEEDLQNEKELFLQFYDAETIDVPVSLATKLDVLTDNLARKNSKKTKPKHIMLWCGVAASIAVVIGFAIHVGTPAYESKYASIYEEYQREKQRNETNQLQFSEVELLEAENAMRLISTNFNKGIEQLDGLNLEMTNGVLEQFFTKND